MFLADDRLDCLPVSFNKAILSHSMEYPAPKSIEVFHSESISFNNFNFVVNTLGITVSIWNIKGSKYLFLPVGKGPEAVVKLSKLVA